MCQIVFSDALQKELYSNPNAGLEDECQLSICSDLNYIKGSQHKRVVKFSYLADLINQRQHFLCPVSCENIIGGIHHSSQRSLVPHLLGNHQVPCPDECFLRKVYWDTDIRTEHRSAFRRRAVTLSVGNQLWCSVLEVIGFVRRSVNLTGYFDRRLCPAAHTAINPS